MLRQDGGSQLCTLCTLDIGHHKLHLQQFECLLSSPLYPQYLIVVLLEEILPANFCTMFCTCCDNPGRRGLYLIPIIICSAVVVLLLTASSSQITARV